VATTLNTVDHGPEKNANAIVEFVEKHGFLFSP